MNEITEKLYLRDAELRSFEAVVTEVDESRIQLDRTAFYATSGGQPHDTGHLLWKDGAASVIYVRTVDEKIWHTLAGPIPAIGTHITGEVDEERRRQMMRTHTAMHILCGVVEKMEACCYWREYGCTDWENGLRNGRNFIRFWF